MGSLRKVEDVYSDSCRYHVEVYMRYRGASTLLVRNHADGNTFSILNGQGQRLQLFLKASTHKYHRLEPLDLEV